MTTFYIKTKDNIFEVVDETELVYIVRAKGNPNNTYSKSKRATDVIKRGNTVRELCDEFVQICPTHRHFVFQTYRKILMNVEAKYYRDTNLSMKQKFCKKISEGYVYYGSIWTDSGLKYVAIADEKGDFVLL